MEGGAAQRRGGQRVQESVSALSPGTPPLTHLCHCEPSQMAWQSSKLCRRVCDTYRIHWIATVAMLPREDKKHHTQFPSMEGCRAAAGWSESSRTSSHSVPRYAAPHISVIASHRRWRGNPVNNKVARNRVRA